MHRFWKPVLEPLLEACEPGVVVEVGAGAGELTAELLSFSADREMVVHAIDPQPSFPVADWQREWGARLVVHTGLSLNALARIEGPIDVALIDGDHNWYTVINELRLLERLAPESGAAPIVALHDVGWPYGRRDVYNAPDAVPDAYRQPHARRGVEPGAAELVEGALNENLHNAIYEHRLQNGVRTAVEDFLAESTEQWEHLDVPGIHGLGLLLPAAALQGNAKLEALARRLGSPEFLRQRCEQVETARLEQEVRGLRTARELEAVSERAEALESSTAELREEADALDAENEQTEVARREARSQLADSRRELRRLAKQARAHESRIERLGRDLEQASAGRENLRAKLGANEAGRENLRAKLGENEAAREKMRAQRDESKDAAKRILERLRSSQASYAKLDATLRDERAALERSSDERRLLEHQLDRRGNELAEAEDALGRVGQALEESGGERQLLQRQLGERESELEGAGEQRERLEAELAATEEAAGRRRERLRAAQLELEAARERLGELESQTQAAQLAQDDLSAARAQIADVTGKLDEARVALSALEGERAELLEGARGIVESRAWRLGHGLARAMRRMSLRRPQKAGGAEALVDRLEADPPLGESRRTIDEMRTERAALEARLEQRGAELEGVRQEGGRLQAQAAAATEAAAIARRRLAALEAELGDARRQLAAVPGGREGALAALQWPPPSAFAPSTSSSNGSSPDRLSIGFLEPHLLAVGGIRRVIETANRLVARGHRITIYVPQRQTFSPERLERRCDWMDCRAEVKYVDEGEADELDVLIFNHEPQWYMLERFARARLRVFLALGCAGSYGKSGGWESLRCSVDLRLANSAWTADCLERETGVRPSVVPTGVNREVFHPVETPKRYPVLCAGDKRAWKGTDVIEAACALLDLPLEKLQGKDLAQETLAEEFCKAEVFAVGSPVEGFGQPGLEALACGVALVTTDNGGSREYAIDEETALVVPPGDPAAMAAAIRRLRADPGLRDRLRHNGLETAKRFSWDTAAEGLERELVGLVSGAIPALPRPADGRLRRPQREPLLSVIVLAWNQLELTQRCIESIRRCTDLPYELIAVDNGSTDDTASYLAAAADVAILNPDNRGFSAGFNQGLARASGEYVCFLNNDTKVPSGWASRLVETISEAPSIGALLPAVTAAPNDITVRGEPRDHVAILPAFREPPSGIALVMRTAIARALGGWGEEYELASAEDTDLFFKLWVNGLDVVLDEAVLVDHVGKASAKQLPDWKQRWIENRHVFLDKWTGSLEDLPRLESCPEALFERNKQLASSVATWMQRYFRKKDQRPAGAGAADLLPHVTRARSAKQLERPVAARPVAVDREVVIEADRSRDSKPLHDREARAIDDREGLAGKGHSDL